MTQQIPSAHLHRLTTLEAHKARDYDGRHVIPRPPAQKMSQIPTRQNAASAAACGRFRPHRGLLKEDHSTPVNVLVTSRNPHRLVVFYRSLYLERCSLHAAWWTEGGMDRRTRLCALVEQQQPLMELRKGFPGRAITHLSHPPLTLIPLLSLFSKRSRSGLILVPTGSPIRRPALPLDFTLFPPLAPITARRLKTRGPILVLVIASERVCMARSCDILSLSGNRGSLGCNG